MSLAPTTISEITSKYNAQSEFFRSGKTRSIDFRIQSLEQLKSTVKNHESEIMGALKQDLGKSQFEAYTSEVGFIYEEINHTVKHLRKWAKGYKVSTPLILQPTSSKVVYQPKGLTLVISPWNYPFQLCLAPVIGSVAAGNCVVIKASEFATATEAIVAKIVKAAFAPEFVTTVEGGGPETTKLLEQKWNHIFFTGSTAVGRIVSKAAVADLTPLTLELGGKSPCIVDKDTDIKVSARRIVWGKFYNTGQTCVAPDYLLVHQDIKSEIIAEMQRAIEDFYGENPIESPDYGRIISDKHFERLISLIEGDVIVGGIHDKSKRYIAPTLIDNVSMSDSIMQDEIFGPLLPILFYRTLEEAFEMVNQHPNPLACYVFTNDSKIERRVEEEISFGGGCVNNVLVHLTNPNLPFGGIGTSGMGSYHGLDSFKTFSHRKAIAKTSFWLDLKLKYPPYKNRVDLIKKLMR